MQYYSLVITLSQQLYGSNAPETVRHGPAYPLCLYTWTLRGSHKSDNGKIAFLMDFFAALRTRCHPCSYFEVAIFWEPFICLPLSHNQTRPLLQETLTRLEVF